MHAGVAHGSKLAADDEDPDFATTGCAFICDTTGGEEDPCDIWAQDCPEGEKCNAWANDGGSSWNSTKCVPIDLEPDKIGDPCTTQGGGVSGIDSCELGAMCWGVGDDNLGTCVELCTCTPDNPVCMTPNTTCAISNNESLILCLPICDPLDTEACGADELCVSNPSGDYFICVVDASGDAGQAGDPCEYLNACDPGHYCGGSNQCAPYCSLSQPECPQGSECVPWYENGQAPQCFEDLGACV